MPKYGQTHSNNSSALFECAWPFCGIGAEKVAIIIYAATVALPVHINYFFVLYIEKDSLKGK